MAHWRFAVLLLGSALANSTGALALEPDPPGLPASPADSTASAAPAAPAPCSSPPAGAPATARCIPALTPVVISIDAAMSSKTAKSGESFAFTLAKPLMLGDAVAIPAGTKGVGEVVHAKGTGIGVGGELVLAARYLDFDGRHIRLRSMKFGVVGQDRQDLTFAVGITAGFPALFIRGKQIEVPAGALAGAKLTEDCYFDVPATGSNPAAGTAPAASPPLQTGSVQ